MTTKKKENVRIIFFFFLQNELTSNREIGCEIIRVIFVEA